jgi:hypothetical protein
MRGGTLKAHQANVLSAFAIHVTLLIQSTWLYKQTPKVVNQPVVLCFGESLHLTKRCWREECYVSACKKMAASAVLTQF